MPLLSPSPDNETSNRQRLLVWWLLWGAFQVGIFIIYFFQSRQNDRLAAPMSKGHPFWVAALVPLTLSIIFRWVVLPRQKNAHHALTFFVIGIALAESVCFMGLFVFQAHHQTLFLLSVVGIFQFIPTFARRLIGAADAENRI